MVIIVEGIDRVGKTTLCEKLSKKLRYPLYKKDRIGEDCYTKEISAFMTYGNALGIVEMVNNGFADNFILDRFHWTEAVYGLYNRNMALPSNLMELIEKEMEKVPEKWLIIYVKPSDINRSIKEHGSDLTKHYSMYNNLASITNLQLMICNGYNEIDSIVDRISLPIIARQEFEANF